MKKQKLLTEKNSILLIDSISIKVSLDANENRDDREQSTGRSKGRLATKLHLCCTFSCPVAFRLFPGNSHDALELRTLIESMHSKNNNYLLMNRAYEDDKILILTKTHRFRIVVSPKKNRKLPWFFYKNTRQTRYNIKNITLIKIICNTQNDFYKYKFLLLTEFISKNICFR